MSTFFFLVLFFILGSAVGSLLSVIISRIHHNEKGIVMGRSKCPKCKKKLHWTHLIPVLSFVMLKGRCAYCEKQISKMYLALELITGAIFAFIYSQNSFFLGDSVHGLLQNSTIQYDVFMKAIYEMVIYTALVLIFVYDYLYQEIPDLFSLPLIVLALLGTIIGGEPSLNSMLIGAAIGVAFFGGQYVVSKGKWLGEGDIRLGFFMGVFLGWQLLLVAIVVSYILGSAISLFLIAGKKAKLQSEIAFGPFLIAGTFIAHYWGEKLINIYLGLY